MHSLRVAISTPEGGSRGYPYIRYPLTDNPLSPGKVDHTTGVYVRYTFRTVVQVLLRPHKSQISESAVRKDLRVFVLIRED